MVHKVTIVIALRIVACVVVAAEVAGMHVTVHKVTQAQYTYHICTLLFSILA